MRCPYCKHTESKVVDSRYTEEHTVIRRRRECLDCQERFTTYERIEDIPLRVIKKNGDREFFDHSKIISGLMKACEKRPVTKEKLEEIVSEIKKELNNNMKQEISSKEIGKMVMERLKAVDEVAYVRFTSVYRQFKDANKFKQELERMLEED